MDLTLQHIIDNRSALLGEFHLHNGTVRDLTRGVALGYSPAFYLYGRPGTAKTHTVRDVLECILGETYTYLHGHVTPLGLFEEISKNPDRLLVLDDMSDLFRNEVSLQILLAIVEPPRGKDNGRIVKYRRQGVEKTAYFRNGIICISNRELHNEHLVGAFKSRAQVLHFNPTDAPLGALMLDLAEKGWPTCQPTISSAECRMVAEFVISEMLRRGRRFDLRLFVNKALPIYQQVKDGEAESDWRDLVRATIDEELVKIRYSNGHSGSRADRKAEEHGVLQEILQRHTTRADQIKAWIARTGKSQEAFYRRLREVRSQ